VPLHAARCSLQRAALLTAPHTPSPLQRQKGKLALVVPTLPPEAELSAWCAQPRMTRIEPR
jgi:hypothetical protein